MDTAKYMISALVRARHNLSTNCLLNEFTPMYVCCTKLLIVKSGLEGKMSGKEFIF